MKTDFVKIEGSGNDFILIDRIGVTDNEKEWGLYVKAACERKFGIGADGVLLLESHPACDFKMRIFNPDGSEVEMCGNGARCCAYYYFHKTGLGEVKFDTLAGVMHATKGAEERVKLNMPSPSEAKVDMTIKLDGNEMKVSYINTGVPHVIVETDQIDSVDVKRIGSGIRYNEAFSPSGTNADFIQATEESSLIVRTYERGVEEETLACGTGVVASAIIAAIKGLVSPPVNVKTRGGDEMKVYFELKEESGIEINNVQLEGGVNLVYKGEIDLNGLI
jgi:diaminopimelate epimerase